MEKEILNQFIEDFIKEKINFDYNKRYVSSIELELSDDKDVMLILQCFDSIIVYINEEYVGTYIKKRVRDDKGKYADMFVNK